MPKAQKKLMRETCGGDSYEYYHLGDNIVAAPGVCGGRPTLQREVGRFILSTGEPEKSIEGLRIIHIRRTRLWDEVSHFLVAVWLRQI
jgi:hypothetical protein